MKQFQKIKEALEYIDCHLDEPIRLESLADTFHFSPYYFHRMFSVIVGKTLAVYVRNRRLERACALLSITDQSILEIGMECGFDTPQSFSRTFKNIYGLSPNEYRKQGFAPLVTTVDEMIIKFIPSYV